MSTLFVRHKVGDYSSWKKGYDAFGTTRKEFGVTGASVHRDANDPNTMIVTHQFRDSEGMMRFAHSSELQTAMANAGVIGAPEIWFSEDIESTSH